MPLTEEEKIKLAKNAFQRFLDKINELFKKQRLLFEKILKRIEERKMEKLRNEINDKIKE